MNKFRVDKFRVLTPLLSAALLAGCAVGPDYEQPAMALPVQYGGATTTTSDVTPHIVADEPIAAFWTLFGDDLLTRLVAQALATNHELRIAAANLDAARAIRGGAMADLFPVVNLGASRDRQRLSADETLSGAVERSTLHRAGIDMSWELDLFGRVRRNLEASQGREQALAGELRAARVSVIAEVASNYMALRGMQEQYAVAQRNAGNQRETLRIVEARQQAGRGTEFDTVRARALLSATQAQLPALRAAVEQHIHRLSVLVGQPPTLLGELLRPVDTLPELPRLVKIGEPAQLLRRRPDIVAAERRLAAATADIGVAQADWFPRVSFTGELGFAARSGGRLGDGDTTTYRYGPGISWSILDFGHLRARVAESEAMARGSLASYEQVVLRALEETESALVQYGAERERLDHLQVSVAANARAAELAHLRFDSGSADFLEVLDVERAQLESDALLSRSRTAAATGLIAVYKALGGGWETAEAVTDQTAALGEP